MGDELSKIQNRVNRQAIGTESQIEAFINRLNRFLDLNLEEVLGKLQSGDISGKEASAIIGSLISELERAGLEKEVGELKAIYANELRYVRDELAEQDLSDAFTTADRPLIDALVNNSLAQVSNKIQGYGLDVQALVMQQVLTGEKVSIKEIKKDAGDKLASQIKTELNTSTMVFSRSVAAAKAEELGLDLFLYVGPNDKITREFCKRVLTDRKPPIYTKDEIARMDNGQGTATQTTGGGYNCRHHWQPVSAERAKELGYNRSE